MRKISLVKLMVITSLSLVILFQACVLDTGNAGAAVVDLGSAQNYAILAKTGVSTVPPTAIVGNIGLSPAAGSYYFGFSQADFGSYALSSQVNGFLYASDMAVPTPANLTSAISAMESAYTFAAGRSSPDFLNIAAGALGGLNLTAGLYTWGSNVSITGNLQLTGGSNDIWIMQISGNLALGTGSQITLNGGAQAKNIVWQVAGEATLGTYSHMDGVILSMTGITIGTGATLNGKAFAQSLVALGQNSQVNTTH